MKKIKWTMRRAILGMVIGCTLFAVIAQTVAFEVTSRQQIRKESLLSNDETLQRIENELNSYIHGLIVKMQTIYTETELIAAMRRDDSTQGEILNYYWSAWRLSEARFDSADQLFAMYIYNNDNKLISSWRKQPVAYPFDLYDGDRYVNESHLRRYLESDNYAVMISGYHNEAANSDILRFV